jgi:aminoglycoside phosphotransferase (APT) family kinase protein
MRRLTLVHGDYSPKNVLVREGSLVLLDHEVIHFGDPAFDLGFAMTHLMSKAHHCRERRALMEHATLDFFDRYSAAIGEILFDQWRIERLAVRHTLACLLARVSGRSPLEYLTESERLAQRRAAVELMASPPKGVSDLISAFLRRV